MSLPCIDKIRCLSYENQHIPQKELEHIKQLKHKIELERQIKKLTSYERAIEYIKTQIIISAHRGLREIKITIDSFTFPLYYYINVSLYNWIEIDNKILTDIVNSIQKEQYKVNYLSIFNKMKGIKIEW